MMKLNISEKVYPYIMHVMGVPCHRFSIERIGYRSEKMSPHHSQIVHFKHVWQQQLTVDICMLEHGLLLEPIHSIRKELHSKSIVILQLENLGDGATVCDVAKESPLVRNQYTQSFRAFRCYYAPTLIFNNKRFICDTK